MVKNTTNFEYKGFVFRFRINTNLELMYLTLLIYQEDVNLVLSGLYFQTCLHEIEQGRSIIKQIEK